MKKISIVVMFAFLSARSTFAQVICFQCFNQNTQISSSVTNLLLNGGFELGNCSIQIPSFCPNSSSYNCDITNWTCTGGGPSTYASIYDANSTIIVEGTRGVYLGNYFCNACTPMPANDDTSCVSYSGCAVNSLPSGYPVNDPPFGSATGVSISQTVNGLVVGDCYVLEFWAGGEDGFFNRGLFAFDCGFGNVFVSCRPTSPSSTDVGTRYIVIFKATSTSHTIKFTNWGHICITCTEVILDDVRLYTRSQLSTTITACDTTCIYTQPAALPCHINDTLFFPNVFTPNNDGKNDSLTRDFECEVRFTVFNRWGNKIYEYKGNHIAWDGKENGKLVSDGVYYYIAESGNKKFKGFIQVIR